MSRNFCYTTKLKSMIGFCTFSLPNLNVLHNSNKHSDRYLKGITSVSCTSGYSVLMTFASKVVAASSQRLADPPQHSLSQSQ